MNAASLVREAVTNDVRALSRTLLTVMAIVIGAFTLTLTTGAGNGINAYIDQTTSSIGSTTALTVTSTPQDGEGPQRYEGAVVEGSRDTDDAPLTADDLTTIREVEGVVTARPVLSLSPDYINHDQSPDYRLQAVGYVEGTVLQLIAGAQPDPASGTRQIALPQSYLDPLDLDDPQDAIDQEVTLGVTDADGTASTLTATVVAVVEPTLGSPDTASANDALATALYDRQSVGLGSDAKATYAAATVALDSTATDADITTLKADLAELGYTAETVQDQLGDFRSVIDTVVLILNGFAVLALLAAGLGIVNTLLMSVKERTREIGLMKAMGMGSGSIFAMFSLEAILIGLIGTALGVGSAVFVGTVVSSVLSGGVLAGLTGLTLLSFTAPTLLGIFGLVLGIAFLAGSIPAWRAARQDPIESLRYE